MKIFYKSTKVIFISLLLFTLFAGVAFGNSAERVNSHDDIPGTVIAPDISLIADITCNPDIDVDNDAGLCGAVVTYDDPIVLPPFQDAILIDGLPSGSFFPVATTTQTFSATDGSGNVVTCSFDVTVWDDEPPVCNTQDVTVYLDANGIGTIAPSDVNDGSSDNCAITSMSLDITEFDCNDADDYNINGNVRIVTLTVGDASGNTSSCDAEVTVMNSGSDSDCDGVADECDICPGGDDSVDNNGDGLPDCAYYPGPNDVDDSWYCSNNPRKKKIYVCHVPPGNPDNSQTLCIAENAVQAHLNHGDWLGPCTSCSDGDRRAIIEDAQEPSLTIFPNPATDYLQLHYESHSEELARLAIINYAGEILWMRSNMDTGELHDYKIDLRERFASGMYMIILEHEDMRFVGEFMIER